MNNEIIISKNTSLLEAMKRMDQLERKLLIICEGKEFIAVISIGDIQRAILKKVDLNDCVYKYTRKDILYARKEENIDEIKKFMAQNRIECMPVVDDAGNLVNIIEWRDLFFEEKLLPQPIYLPVVIMAGGKGERLKPLTNFIPKPLIPVSDKTIIEEIIERFLMAQCRDFYLSVNYKADMLIDYFETQKTKNYSVEFIRETKPLGTGGSIGYLRNIIKGTFIVTNCDGIIDVNLYDLIEFHKSNHYDATMVSVVKSYDIPYGVIETTENGELVSLKEKPDIPFQINCGLYILEPIVFKYIENDCFLNITDLLIKMKNNHLHVGVFPISEKSWIDMGNWNEYLHMIRKI